MTPKDEAKRIFDQYYKLLFLCETTKDIAKKCALITVNQVILSFKMAINDYKPNSWHPACWWEKVKNELENL